MPGLSPAVKPVLSWLSLLADPVSLRMVQAFSEISDQRTRRAVLALVESMNSSAK